MHPMVMKVSQTSKSVYRHHSCGETSINHSLLSLLWSQLVLQLNAKEKFLTLYSLCYDTLQYDNFANLHGTVPKIFMRR